MKIKLDPFASYQLVTAFIICWCFQTACIPSLAMEAAAGAVDSTIIRIEIQQVFSGNASINPFTERRPISSLSVSCDIDLTSENALVRIILIDQYQVEYLMLESYPLISNHQSFSLDQYSEETAYLSDIVPVAVKIEIAGDATLLLKEIIIGHDQKFLARTATDNLMAQRSEKIARINENLRKKGALWVAGETTVSMKRFEEKRMLFGGVVPNLQGLEFYTEGIYKYSESGSDKDVSINADSIDDTIMVPEFDWRNRHGANKPGSPYYNHNNGSAGWITPVKDQGSCGSCWIFGPVAALEAHVNLYFNQHIDLDLSEQQVLSCNSFGGGCLGASAHSTLDFAINPGLVVESCFPYVQDRIDCSGICTSPTENIRIPGYSNFQDSSYNQIKRALITKGPLSANTNNWVENTGHSMCLVGYGKIMAGDAIYINGQSILYVDPLNPNIGETYWIFKNSWGPGWGEQGYFNVINDRLDKVLLLAIDPQVMSLHYNEDSISCNDFDGDGYYYWGLGAKPSTCPVSPDLPDGDDSDPCLGPLDANGNICFFTPYPTSGDTMVSACDPVPELHADGSQIKWYDRQNKSQLLHSGNNFTPNTTNPGVYSFYITQTISGCESDIVPVILTINPVTVEPPVASDMTYYTTDSVPSLYASGENVKWYGDTENPLIDSRDEQEYRTVYIGKQLWMAENLNYSMQSESWYYDNDSSKYAATYGKLYSNASAMDVCPEYWSLPSDSDWMELEVSMGLPREETYINGYRGEGIGSKLKEAGSLHWSMLNIGSTDSVGFTVRPAGLYNLYGNSFTGLGQRTYFHTSTQYSQLQQYARIFEDYETKIGRILAGNIGYSVRCVQYPAKQVIHAGNHYKPDYHKQGKYIYYVTQTVCGTESQRDTVKLTILQGTRPPSTNDVIVCEGQPVRNLIAEGQNIRWYADSSLENLLYAGSVFQTSKTQPGVYIYYVTQSIMNMESKPKQVALTIHPSPVIDLGPDTIIHPDETLIVGPFPGDFTYKWNDGTDKLIFETTGLDLGIGNHKIFVVVEDVNGCKFSDTLYIQVLPSMRMEDEQERQSIRLYPNPAKEMFTLDLGRFYSHADISIIGIDGNLLFTNTVHSAKEVPIPLDIDPGIYIVTVMTEIDRHVLKLVKE